MPKAAQTLLLGHHGLIEVGEDVPASYRDDTGVEHQTDFTALADAGLVDKAAATKAVKATRVEAATAQVVEAKAELKAAAPAPVPAPAPATQPQSKK